MECLGFLPLFAQDDSTKVRELEEVVITATRNERTMGALPMPVTLVQTPMIKTMGSVRLNDVLTEQTGLVVVPQVNGMGNGIQIQGFNPDYTLILVDGEPLIGRFTGSLELSRLTVGNIKQIEIVKGPSSSLYGSEALAGVINIITEKPTANTGRFSTRYSTNNTLDINATAGLVGTKWSASVFANRYSTDGYDLSPEVFGKTVSPFRNYTLGTRISGKLSSKTEISVGGRYFNERQDYHFDVVSGRKSIRTLGNGDVSDWNLNPVLTHRFSEKLKGTARYYTTQYSTNTDLRNQSNDSLMYQDNFKQSFTRYEATGEYFFNEQHISTLGVGLIDESVNTPRYYRGESQETKYVFAQHEWLPSKHITVILGGRYDQNSVYGSQLSPKFCARWDINPRFSLKASIGVGFKAPDFRQLYYNFYNAAGGGYNILGTEVINTRIQDFENQGLIASYVFDPKQLDKLEAEKSLSFNLGSRIQLTRNLWWDVNIFRNTVDNLIETQTIALVKGSGPIISYRNIKRAIMQGVETDFSYALNKSISFSLGYQLLFAKDRKVIDDIDNGQVFWRDPATSQTQRLSQGEYFGLHNRSRHTGNFKVFFRDPKSGWEGSARVVYRGKFGIGDVQGNIQGQTLPLADRNNNSILDKYDSFVSGYALVNVSIAKLIQQFRFQFGIDNLFDYTDAIYVPNLPGRLVYGSVSFSLFEKYKNQ